MEDHLPPRRWRWTKNVIYVDSTGAEALENLAMPAQRTVCA